MGAKMEQWRRDYVIAHKDDRPRTKVMRDAGVSNGGFYKILHEVGAEMDYTSHRRAVADIDEIVREMYPTMSPREIGAVTGIDCGYIGRWARRLGLKHTPETTIRLREKAIAGILRPKSEESLRKGARKRRVTMRMEYMRLWCNEPRRTKLPLAQISERAYKARWHLVNRWGYAKVEGEPYTLIRPEKPNPNINEAHYAKRYGLKFIDRNDNGNETEPAGDSLR